MMDCMLYIRIFFLFYCWWQFSFIPCPYFVCTCTYRRSRVPAVKKWKMRSEMCNARRKPIEIWNWIFVFRHHYWQRREKRNTNTLLRVASLCESNDEYFSANVWHKANTYSSLLIHLRLCASREFSFIGNRTDRLLCLVSVRGGLPHPKLQFARFAGFKFILNVSFLPALLFG